MRLTSLIAIGNIALASFSPLPLTAQTPRRVDNENAAWLVYTGIHPISKSWRLQLEAQLRQTEGANQPQQRLYRTGLLRVLNPVARVGFGYAHTRTYPPEEFVSNPVPFLEHRTYQQFDLRQTTGPVVWDNRYRLEQRWTERVTTVGPGTGRRQGWAYTNRARYMLKATIAPGGGAPTAGEPYLIAFDELFVNWGGNVRGNVFDQNRLFGGIGYRLRPTLGLEAGYLNHLVIRANGTDVERHNTLLVGFFSDLPLRK